MEKNFNTDNFEQLLRETTDEFRLYPSKRVWHSIYNDLHPARKWPSVAILLLLITSIMYVGVTNSNEANTKNVLAVLDKTKNPESLVKISSNNNTAINDIKASSSNGKNKLSPGNISDLSVTTNLTDKALTTEYKASGSVPSGIKYQSAENNTETSNDQNQSIASESNTLITAIPVNAATELNRNVSMIEGNTKNSPLPTLIASTPAKGNAKESVAKFQVNAEEKSWMEDFVMYNKKPSRKWKDRVAYQVYVTPSVGYRSYKKNTDFELPASTSLLANPGMTNAPEYSLNHSHSLNLEGGTNLIFSFSSKLRFKAGLQFNYTNYRINAFVLNHPTFTSLLLNNSEDGHPILSTRSTSLANTPGPSSKNLNNNTYQLSIPLGADYKLAGNDNLKWYAGASIQPTYVTGGNAYLVSADLKNYVTDENMMRKFNVNAGFETFLSYKTRSGVILSAGPQFRLQVLSTYTKEYSYDEKLYNMGVKLGMTRSF